MTSLSLAEELVLLSYDDSGTATVASPDLDYAVAGAVLCDLALGGQVLIDTDGRIRVGEPTGDPPTGRDPTNVDPTNADPGGGTPGGGTPGPGQGRTLLDRVRARIGGQPGRPTRDWVMDLSRGVVDDVLDGLVGSGVLRRKRDRVLWVLPRTRFAPPDGVEPPAETEARRRLATAGRDDGPVEPRSAALASLLDALDVPDLGQKARPRETAGRPRAGLGPATWPTTATAEVIDEHRTRVAGSVFTATDVASGSS